MATMPEVIDELELASIIAQVEEEEEEEEEVLASTAPEEEGDTSSGSAGDQAQQSSGPRPSGRTTGGGGTGSGDGGGGGDGDDDGGAPWDDEDDDEDERREPDEEQDGQPAEERANTGPVGQGDYIVREGDCIASIAKEHGHFWEKIWNEAANSELKEVRKDPNVLLPEDRVTIPELEAKQEPGATEEHHRFRRKGEPVMLRLQFVGPPERDDDDEQAAQQEEETRREQGDWTEIEQQAAQSAPQEDVPRANVPYVLVVEGERTSGETDADGKVEVAIPGGARRAEITLNPGTEQAETYPLQIGRLAPISEVVGVKQRLANLTFECGDRTDEETPAFEAAVQGFQRKHGLPSTGQVDEDTRNRLREVHGI